MKMFLQKLMKMKTFLKKVEEFEEEISPTKTHEHSFSRPSLTKTIAIGLIVTVVGGIIVLGVWELFFPEISK